MSEDTPIPGQFTAGGHTWRYHVYDNGTRHQWYRAMTDEEVRNHTNGRIDGVDDIDFPILWSVTEYPVYMIELHHVPSRETVSVMGHRTYFGPPRPGMTDTLGSSYHLETDDREAAIRTVSDFAQSLS